MILKEILRKANKKHVCDCCKAPIIKTEIYLHLSIKDKENNYVYSVKYCYACRGVKHHIDQSCWECPYLHSNTPYKNYLMCDEDCC